MTSYTWDGILTGVPHFWRINLLTPGGWVASATGTLVPCGSPVLLWGPMSCAADGTVTVHFRWSPASPLATQQWLDISKIDSSFRPGTFSGVGPLAPWDDHLSLPLLVWGQEYFFRVNARYASAGAWRPSTSASFVAMC